MGHLCRGRWACSLCLPFSTFILLEKELQEEPTGKSKGRTLLSAPRAKAPLTCTEVGVEAGDGCCGGALDPSASLVSSSSSSPSSIVGVSPVGEAPGRLRGFRPGPWGVLRRRASGGRWVDSGWWIWWEDWRWSAGRRDLAAGKHSIPLSTKTQPILCWTMQAEPSASLSRQPSHIQSLPPHSFGLAPLLLGIQPLAGSPRTVLHLGYEVRLPLAQGTQVFQGSGFQALAVRRNRRDSLGIVPKGPNLPKARDLVTLSTYHLQHTNYIPRTAT